MVSASSSRRRADVQRTSAFYCSSPKYKNNPNPSPTEIRFGLFFFGASVLIGLFKKLCHTNGFSDFWATSILVSLPHELHFITNMMQHKPLRQFPSVFRHPLYTPKVHQTYCYFFHDSHLHVKYSIPNLHTYTFHGSMPLRHSNHKIRVMYPMPFAITDWKCSQFSFYLVRFYEYCYTFFFYYIPHGRILYDFLSKFQKPATPYSISCFF